MRKHIVDLAKIDVVIPAGTPAGVIDIEAKIPKQYTTIVGLALFIEEQPLAVTDFKIALSSDRDIYLPMASKNIYVSNENVPPNNKFLTGIAIPCEDSKVVKLETLTNIEIPANTTLKFSVVMQVVDKQKYAEATRKQRVQKEPSF